MRSMLSTVKPGSTVRSPASATEIRSQISIRWCGWYGRSITEIERMASGAKRAPTRNVAPVSNGTPTMNASHPLTSVTWGRRMKVRMPTNRGESRPLTGRYIGLLRAADELAVLQDHVDASQARDIVERIGRHRDQVGQLAGCHGAEPILDPAQLGGGERRG